MYTMPDAPGAAKFLLNWPNTDANITNRSGESFLDRVRSMIDAFSDCRFLLQQWREIEEMLVKMGATGTGITTLE
jgi:hypothetical protein